MSESKRHFVIVDFDGWNLGLRGYFSATWLVFDSFHDAADIAVHWDDWINGEDV